MVHLKASNGSSKYALTIIFTIGYVSISILGILFNGEMFLYVFPAITVLETIIVKDLFEREREIERIPQGDKPSG
ncbi:hypothetical protein ES702_05206 [subsurface metagenome]